MTFKLTADEVKKYHTDGYLGPFTLFTPEQVSAFRAKLDRVLAPCDITENQPSMIALLNPAMRRGFGRHHDQPFLFDIANSPAIKDRVVSILGTNLLLWRTMFFAKEPGEKLIPWHQDYDGWMIEPIIVTSAWLAFDRATKENGCVQLIPGSHRQFYPLVPSPQDVMDGFANMADPGAFEASNVVSMELEPGQFFIFNERLLHRSLPNTTNTSRLGFAMRFIPTLVQSLDPDDHPILISGHDEFGFNQLAPTPTPLQPATTLR